MFSCNQRNGNKTTGNLERFDAGLDKIITSDAQAEIIAEGFEWSEGPLWIENEKMLLFSDVPTNKIYKWTEDNGKEVYLEPSGYTDTIPRGGEIGSNGLLLDNDGRLILCQHGNRQIARMDAPLNDPRPNFISLASRYNGMRFSSPNDAAINSQHEIFFTDPPYGLPNRENDTTKETPWNGVYKIKQDGTVILLVDSITRPNGIAFMPGGKKLVIANSDPGKPYWYIYDVGANDSLINGKIFYDASPVKNVKGLPDGFKIDKNGNVIASGPGGVYFFNSDGKLLGRVNLEHAASNCALSADERTLYITNDMQVLRLKMRN